MWCELVLNGIGGTTIEEAQRNLSAAEYCTWAEYRAKRGSLNQMLRTDRGFALLACLYSARHGGKPALYDFLPHEQEPEITLEQAMKDW